MRAYAGICQHMLAYAGVCLHMLAYNGMLKYVNMYWPMSAADSNWLWLKPQIRMPGEIPGDSSRGSNWLG
jgi:hypothetical protein